MSQVTPPSRPVHDMELHSPGGLPSWWWIPAAAVGGVVVLALLVWWMRSPQDLPVDGDGASTTTKAGRVVYVGLTEQGSGARSLTIRGVDLGKPAEGATVEALVCRGGMVTVTTNAEPFCEELVEAEGTTLDLPGDQLLVSVTADQVATVTLDDMEVSFREGLQWGSQELPAITVEVAD